MRILFDYKAFDMQTHGGVTRCFVELIRHLSKEEATSFLSIRESNNEYLLQQGYKYCGYKYDHFIKKGEFFWKKKLFNLCYKKIWNIHYWDGYNKYYSIKQIQKGDFDIFHPTFYDDYFLPYLNGKPFVITIHDMIPELYPQYFKSDDVQIRMKRKLAPLASAIVTVSEKTKEDVVRILNIPEEKVHVIYHGAMEDVSADLASSNSPFSFPYILYVGDRYGYKNFVQFAKASTKVLERNPDLKIVCTGKPFTGQELALFEEIDLRDRFVHYFVPDNTAFQTLYHYAKVFVYPSDYEGFGIPILEAYQAGCPVLLNNASCFPEVAGDAAIYFNGFDKASDFAEKLSYSLSLSAEDRADLLALQRERLKLYSWKKSAEKLVELYQNIIEC